MKKKKPGEMRISDIVDTLSGFKVATSAVLREDFIP